MKRMYCVFDEIALEYFPPFVALSDDQARMECARAVSTADSLNYSFSLYYVGDFESQASANINPIQTCGAGHIDDFEAIIIAHKRLFPNLVTKFPELFNV